MLVESIGFKAGGRSAPLADLKGKTTPSAAGTTTTTDGFSANFGRNSNSNSLNGSSFAVDDLDGIFRSSSTNHRNNAQSTSNNFDDIFGGPNVSSGGGAGFDLDSVFSNVSGNGNNSKLGRVDDLFGEMPGLKRYGSSNNVDDMLFGGGVSAKQNGAVSGSVDDLLGSFGGMGFKSNGGKKEKENGMKKSDDLIPGFGGSFPSSNGSKPESNLSQQSNRNPTKSFSTSAEDPFVMLERTQGRGGGESVASEDDYLDSFFSSGTQSGAARSQRSTTEDSVFDALFQNIKSSKVEQTSSVNSSSKKKASPAKNTADDFSFMFGMGAAPSSGEFQEVEGESAERRRARLNHHMRTQERMAKVLNEKNLRDLQTQREQEERHRLAETLDDNIKRWAAGKEGNLRALLSSLQYVLWPECGWQPISLTDLITSTSVKKVYYKATLCVHPDKVQQKGANLQQKYTAEKVFDILKEAWNKFNSEELRKR